MLLTLLIWRYSCFRGGATKFIRLIRETKGMFQENWLNWAYIHWNVEE